MIHGTTAHESRPGTIAATNQLAQVTSTFDQLEGEVGAEQVARLAGEEHRARHRRALIHRGDEERAEPAPRSGPDASRTTQRCCGPTGSTMPALRAVIEGTPDASVTSVISSA